MVICFEYALFSLLKNKLAEVTTIEASWKASYPCSSEV